MIEQLPGLLTEHWGAIIGGTVVVLFLILVIAGPQLMARSRGVKNMSADDLAGRLEGKKSKRLVLLDVRSDGEFKGGHIRQARHLPLNQIQGSAKLLKGMQDAEVVCICASGRRSAVAAIHLKQAGFNTVYNLSGGMARWQGEVKRGR